MNEYLIIGLKTILFLSIILVIIRIMGKKELGELNVFDIIVSFMISEIFSNAIAEPDTNIFLAILPIFIIFFVQLCISYVGLKSKKIRDVIESKPTLIIEDGVILYNEMKKQRYNISDLLQQVREEGIDDISDIRYAILESNGGLSIIKKSDSKLKYPFPLISDGKVIDEVKENLKISDDWLSDKLKEKKLDSLEDVFIGFISINNDLLIFSKKFDNVK